MADNTLLNAGTGGDTIATDDIAGIKHQLVKVEFGAADSATQVSAASPFPDDPQDRALRDLGKVDIAVFDSSLPAGTNNIGDVDVLTLPALPAGTNNIGDVDLVSGPPSVVSTGNSSTATLGISGVFTGTGEEVKDYAVITVLVKSDVASATDGLSLQYSSDNTNWDDTDVYTISANTGKFFTIPPEGRYFRIVYTNGGTAQTFFRLQTIYHYRNVKPSSHRITASDLPNDENDAELVIAISQGIVAHDAPVAGKPIYVAAISETMDDSAPGNRVSVDTDVQRLSSTDGALYVIPTGPQTWSYHENSSSALTDTTVHAAPGAGLSIYITDIIVSTGAATAFNIFFEASTTTTILGPFYLEATAGRGLVIHFGTPKKVTANTLLSVTTSAAIAHSIDVTGFIAPG